MRAAAFALAVAFGLGCGGAGFGVGRPCDANAQCDAPLECLLFTSDSRDCSPELKACSIECSTDADCQKLGGDLVCFRGCRGNPDFCAKKE